ncbi:radical SAM methylthiotransferase, MiaB/RimO family [Chthonomonas calidirosea]|uniref:tRNA-2-methylthio-N(6)-dimethylallyladenosine synthase n=1 Tax=Chthonomonas calidirosea (strain DSM 23976 / ICMP 18418 / T49) TaxID=1303518 RepID=S0EVC1_CHTCT|nr:MiaB/RimO family radical SAM methylthiotransferase [Chthonomonas calidirosea]CCW34302.1 radical SAM methylthiotransferase, MiaB/RimO family [Chthonomonas calidirosea T49]CEK15166.1 radical SAM methylthiotransferase, MiaB/RimO family [Chthonomonas calidirosea]
MPTAAFMTLGCKVNQYETQRILDDFERHGFTITEFHRPADIYVVNTCSVTQAAERKSRNTLRRARRLNPNAIVVMTGCYAEMARIKGEAFEEVNLIVPNPHKMQTLNRLLEAFPEIRASLQNSRPPSSTAPTLHRRTRATIKVQDGCDVFCTFCSIPYTRTQMVSRPMGEIVSEVERLADQGFTEIVITGVLVGAYGQEPGFEGRSEGLPRGTAWTPDRIYQRPDLADLLLALAKVEGIRRIRLSSIEPTQITDRLLEAFASEQKLCPHLHIPLQSGSDKILAAMNRPYNQRFYLERCAAAKARIPDLAITADIMVGFPGEDRKDFEQTLYVAREVGYARAHVFRYSPRPNTPAATMADQVSDAEKEARSQELIALCRETQKRFIQSYLGRTMEVLVEGKGAAVEPSSENESIPLIKEEPSGLLGGYTGNYIRVQFTGGSHLIGKLVQVRLLETTLDGAIGEIGDDTLEPMPEPPADSHSLPLATLSGQLLS